MNLIICVDNDYGMSYNGRRQSRDRAVTEKILQLCADKKLWIHSKTRNLFPSEAPVLVADDCLRNAGENDVCFIENEDVSEWIDRINKVTIFRWNRRYPSDLKFPYSKFEEHWKMVIKEEFSGHSHQLITMEVYEL